MTIPPIDLNADLGEGFGRWRLTDDEALLDSVTSANVACGFHAGDAPTMRRVCERAVERGVTIGAQVSYLDLAGFGRRPMDVPRDELAAEVAYQVGALDVFARAAGGGVAYVKPHGALYNRVVRDDEQASAVIEGVQVASRAAGVALAVLCLPGSALLREAAAAGVPAVTEAFADRGYLPDGSLQPRSQPGAVLDEPDAVVGRAVAIARRQPIVDSAGAPLLVHARSLCVHGDTPGAAALAARVRAALESDGVVLQSFVGGQA